ncbi:MAG: glycosyltransferase, partial [Flavobacteriales bacterium]|nr:glycosyltransferase [Flavobacteriales bacterium]
MSLLAFILPVAYLLLLLWMHFEWLALKKGTESLTTNPNPQVQLSVVIPFRNERSNLEPLLKSLHLASSKVSFELEFIFVDDESDDYGAELLANSLFYILLVFYI